MSLIAFEGFESHNAISDMVYNDVPSHQTCALLTAADANTGPRLGGGGCFRGTSTGVGPAGTNVGNALIQYFQNNWPRFLLKPPVVQNNQGLFGFAFYPKLTSPQVWSEGEATFTPLVAVCDANLSPHFFIGITATNALVVYRWEATEAALWNSGQKPLYFGQYGALDRYTTVWGDQTDLTTSLWYRYATPSAARFTLLGTSSNPVVLNQWNYIELKYLIDHTAGNTGTLQMKINRETSDSGFDLDLTGLRNSKQAANTVGGIAFGQFLGYRSSYSTLYNFASTGAYGQVTYYDDIYWENMVASAGANPFNTWLGPIQIKSLSLDTLQSNTFNSFAGVSALAAVNGKLSAASLADYLQTNADLQKAVLRAGGASAETQAIMAVNLQSTFKRISGPSRLFLGATYGGQSVELPWTVPLIDGGSSQVLEQRPDGSSWTPATLATTDFYAEQRP